MAQGVVRLSGIGFGHGVHHSEVAGHPSDPRSQLAMYIAKNASIYCRSAACPVPCNTLSYGIVKWFGIHDVLMRQMLRDHAFK